MPDKPDFDQEPVAKSGSHEAVPEAARLEFAEARRQATGRQCGKCTMCCTVLGVDEPPHLTKPPDTKCQHCVPGKGCMIYERRPRKCQNFYCQWLVDPKLDDLWYPLTAKIVILPGGNADGSNTQQLVFEVDPRRPDRWLQHPYFERITKYALTHRTTVRAGKHWYTLIPRGDAENSEKVTLGWRSKITTIKPDKIGPGYFKTPRGDFRWVEVVPLAEFFDTWRSSASRV